MEVLTAIAEGNPEKLAAALATGSNPNVVDTEGVPALLHAADTGNLDLVRPLLEAGASLAAVDNIGWTTLMASIAAKSEELVGFLLTNGANANHVAREDTPLTIATADAPLSIVTLLLNHGADANLRRPDGWTPLMLAAFRGDPARIRLLLEHGADATVTMGSRLMDAATIAAAHRHHMVRDLLIDAARTSAPDLGELWGGIQKWCEANAPELAERFENTVGSAELPEDWGSVPPEVEQQLTNWASGLPFYDYRGMGIDEAVAAWSHMNERMERGEFAGRTPNALGTDEPIARQYWEPGWIPVAKDTEGNLLLVDTAPDETGVVGQLISWSSEQGPLSVLASGLVPYLRLLAARLRGSRLKVDKRSGGLIPV